MTSSSYVWLWNYESVLLWIMHEECMCVLSRTGWYVILYQGLRIPHPAHGHGNLIITPHPPSSLSPTPESVQWIHPSSLISGLGLCLYRGLDKYHPETTREHWFPQRLAENNKILHIPAACIMVVAFSAELASPEGKTTFQPLNAPPCVKQWPLNCPADFPALLRSTAEISPLRDCNVQTKRYLKSLAGTMCFWICCWKECSVWRGGYTRSPRCLFLQKWLFVSFEQRGSPEGNESVSVDKTHWLCCYSLEW